MSLHINACLDCGEAHFPARLRCPRCGGRSFAPQAVDAATVTGVVPVHRRPQACPWRFLVELRAAGGVALLAGAAQAPQPGTLVPIAQREDGAIVVSPH